MKSYLNGIRKQIYGQLADTVEQAAPNSDIKALNSRMANAIEAQGLLERRIALEHGTGGYNAAARKIEFWGGLASALFSPEPITKGLGAAAVGDRALRSVAGKMTTAKTLANAGDALQSEAGQATLKAVAQVPKLTAAQSGDWIKFRSSDNNLYRVHPEDLAEVQRRDPKGRIIQ